MTASGKGFLGFIRRHTKLTVVLATFIAVGLLVLGVGVGKLVERGNQARVDTHYVDALLTKASELTSAKFNYTGMTRYEDEGVPVINKASFIMVYKATARAGIDMDKVGVQVDDAAKTVTLSIPKAEVLDVNVDSSSIEYFDEGFAIANLDQKEDSNRAIALAKKDAMTEARTSGVLEMADTQSELLIKGILQPAVPDDYTFKVTKTAGE